MNIIPRAEHPRPQMIRENWINLNGNWDFAFDFSQSGKERGMENNGVYDRIIKVPFCPESKLSGIGYTDFIPAVWYRKNIEMTKEQLEEKVTLHFGAVDYLAELWVNGVSVGSHKGGYSSFEFEISSFLNEGSNEITLLATDDVRSGKQPAGKQSDKLNSYKCLYTRTTGIWQTVWLEFVPKTYIKSYKIKSNLENKNVFITVDLENNDKQNKVTATASFNNEFMGETSVITSGNSAYITLDLNEAYPWEVGKGNLYDLTLKLDTGDEIKGYFGLRTIEWKNKAMYLNGKIVYQRLILDQGFYPDGIYTAPTDEDLEKDIKLSMDLGFNGARMHEKVFEERYMYHADKLGYLTWGEMASWKLDLSNAEALKILLPEWLEIVERDFNHPSIIGWCPFNETWNNKITGAKQDDDILSIVYKMTKAIDNTRPVIDTSGNFHVITDIYDVHNYEQNPEIFRNDFSEEFKKGKILDKFEGRQNYAGQPYFISEYGGTWWVPNAQDCEIGTKPGTGAWGYGIRPKTEAEFLERYVGLTSTLLDFKEICAFCYTQLTDVEQEQNGLYDYHRNKKFSENVYDAIRAVNTKIAEIEK